MVARARTASRCFPSPGGGTITANERSQAAGGACAQACGLRGAAGLAADTGRHSRRRRPERPAQGTAGSSEHPPRQPAAGDARAGGRPPRSPGGAGGPALPRPLRESAHGTPGPRPDDHAPAALEATARRRAPAGAAAAARTLRSRHRLRARLELPGRRVRRALGGAIPGCPRGRAVRRRLQRARAQADARPAQGGADPRPAPGTRHPGGHARRGAAPVGDRSRGSRRVVAQARSPGRDAGRRCARRRARPQALAVAELPGPRRQGDGRAPRPRPPVRRTGGTPARRPGSGLHPRCHRHRSGARCPRARGVRLTLRRLRLRRYRPHAPRRGGRRAHGGDLLDPAVTPLWTPRARPRGAFRRARRRPRVRRRGGGDGPRRGRSTPRRARERNDTSPPGPELPDGVAGGEDTGVPHVVSSRRSSHGVRLPPSARGAGAPLRGARRSRPERPGHRRLR